MRAIWRAAVEAPVVLLMVACTGTGGTGGFLAGTSLPAATGLASSRCKPPAPVSASAAAARRRGRSADWPPPDEQVGEGSNGRGYRA